MYIGFDIGGTKCAVVLSDGKEILKKEVFKTEAPDLILPKMLECAKGMTSDAEAAGISCGGPLDEEKGLVLSPPNLPGWDAVPIKDIISESLKIPAYLCNDANAGALAEWKFGAGKGTKNMVFFTFGTGLGAGIIAEGHLIRGANGNAGEIGHVRADAFGPVGYGKAGSYEGFCSGNGIKQLGQMKAYEAIQNGKPLPYCRSLSDLDKITPKMLQTEAERGDETAIEVYNICARKLGQGIALLTDLLNPELVVIGSVYARAEHLLRDIMWEYIRRDALPGSADVLRVVPASLGEHIGDYAAVSVAMCGKDIYGIN